jgi:hypothetical protein
VNPRLLQRAIWTGATVLGAAAVIGWVRGRPRAAAMVVSSGDIAGSIPALHAISTDSIDDAAAATSDHDPFRLTREPSSVAYTADREGAPPPPPPPPKPLVALSGVVGPPWVAVLEGVPGKDGSVLAKVGDTLSRPPLALLVVRRVERDTVVVLGADTTWKLTVRRPWR